MLEERSKELANPAMAAIKDMIGLKGMLAVTTMNPAVASGFIAANSVLKNSRTPLVMAKTLDKIGKAHLKYPDHPMWKGLIMSANINMDQFRNEFSNVISKVSFLENPLPRNVEGVKSNKENIVSFIRSESGEDIANDLDNAITHAKDKDISQIMSNILKDAEADLDQYIEEGVGFDGKVYSPEEKAFFKSEIDSSDAPLGWKLKAAKDLRENGTIPTSPQESIMVEKMLREQEKKRSFIQGKQGPRY
jgi:hypothetical protein